VSEFEERLAAAATATEAMLDRLLAADPRPGESVRPERVLSAMRYAALSGGKRLRPFLLIEAARLFGRSDEGVVRAAAALECVHCYSLIHDDLPAMDDDDLRRGRPTVHRAYDEATAILAGDGLLTLAFDVLSDPATHPDAEVRLALIGGLARGAGVGGMVGGQMLDLEGEKSETADEPAILRMQAMKTGALIRYACEAGAILGGAGAEDRQRLTLLGETIGLAFQLADDLLDLTGDAATLGKAAGKDAARGKKTIPGLRGEAATRIMLGGLVAEAEALLSSFETGETLAAAARFIATRRN
jgi:farnesyl diphosphate synthase